MTTSASALLTEIMLAVFRLNGQILDGGDRLVEPLGLTSARWQVLGAVALAGRPLTAPQIAEAMGISRQGAQKQLNRLCEEGLFAARPNPRHERSPLYELTELGNDRYQQAIELNQRWAQRLARPLDKQALQKALETLRDIEHRISAEGEEQA